MNKTVKKLIRKIKKKNKLKFNVSFNSFFNNNRFSMLEVVLLLFVTLFIGVMIGYFATHSLKNTEEASTDLYITKVYEKLLNDYYLNVSQEELEKSAINGMLNYLDDNNTVEVVDEYYTELKEQVNGYFCGIGVSVVYENDKLEVIKVIEGSPANKAGLEVNDVLLEVDGIEIDENNYQDLIRGKCDSKFTLKYRRDKKEKKVVVNREPISLGNVTSKMFDIDDKHIGYIDVDAFSLDSYELFINNLNRLENKDISSLIIDLRGNPGGTVSSTRKIMNLFFEKNVTLYSFKSRNKKTFIKDGTPEKRDYPIVLLIDETTASSAEIFASCFKENYENVTLVGKASFGKNTIQSYLSLDDDYGIKYTISEWFTSKGNSVLENGVIPDVEIAAGGVTYYEDTQLQEAISILKK